MLKKDCLFIAMILLLSQYIIFQWTYNFGSDKNLLDHISFAGTIISIILAIVAIIYSFIQAESQNRSSSQIASQITSLRDVVKDIDLSKIQFANELDRIEHIASKLDDLDSHVNASHREISSVLAGVEKLSKQFERSKHTEVDSIREIIPPAVGNVENGGKYESMVFATLHTRAFSYCLRLASGKGISENDLIMNNFALPITQISSELKGDAFGKELGKHTWSALQIIRIFKALGYVEIEEKSEIVKINPEFMTYLESIDFEAPIINIYDEWLRVIKKSFAS